MTTVARKLMDAPASGGGGGYSLNLTVGSGSGPFEGYYGYFMEGYGSIDQEFVPEPGYELLLLHWIPNTEISIVVFGDVTGLFAGLDLYVDSVNYGGASEWVYFSEDDYTGYTNATTTPSMTSGTYLVEIK